MSEPPTGSQEETFERGPGEDGGRGLEQDFCVTP